MLALLEEPATEVEAPEEEEEAPLECTARACCRPLPTNPPAPQRRLPSTTRCVRK